MVNNGPPKNRYKFGNVWAELDYLCKKIHYWWHVRNVRSSARRYVSRLERVLAQLPKNDMAIVREEGLALLHELKGQSRSAIMHREREIQLMEKLQCSVQKSVEAGEYDQATAASILVDRDARALRERRAILQTLKKGAVSQVAC